MSEILIIEFERSGGFAGIPVKATLDDQVLDRNELDQIDSLIEKSGFLHLKNSKKPEMIMPDQFLYKITVVTPSFRHSVAIYEKEITPDLRPLIRLLLDFARRRK